MRKRQGQMANPKHENDVYQGPDELIPPETYLPIVRDHFEREETRYPSWFNVASLPAEKFFEKDLTPVSREQSCSSA